LALPPLGQAPISRAGRSEENRRKLGSRQEAIVRANWVLEIYCESKRKNSLISAYEFHDFLSLQAKIEENRAYKLLIDPPDHATSDEFQSLLDLRGQGFKVQRK